MPQHLPFRLLRYDFGYAFRYTAQDSTAFCYASADGRLRIQRLSAKGARAAPPYFADDDSIPRAEEIEAGAGEDDEAADLAWWSPC